MQSVRDLFGSTSTGLGKLSEKRQNFTPWRDAYNHDQFQGASGDIPQGAKRALQFQQEQAAFRDTLNQYDISPPVMKPILTKNPHEMKTEEVIELIDLLCSDAKDDDREKAADQLRLLSRETSGRRMLRNTGKMHVIIDLLVDPDLVTKLALIVLNLAFNDAEIDLRDDLIKVGAITKLGLVLSYARRAGRLAAICALRNLASGSGYRKDIIVRSDSLIKAVVGCVEEKLERLSTGALGVLMATVTYEDSSDSAQSLEKRKDLLVQSRLPQALVSILEANFVEAVGPALHLIICLLESSTTRLRAFSLARLPSAMKLIGTQSSNDPETIDTIADIEFELVRCNGGELDLFSYPTMSTVFPSMIGCYATYNGPNGETESRGRVNRIVNEQQQSIGVTSNKLKQRRQNGQFQIFRKLRGLVTSEKLPQDILRLVDLMYETKASQAERLAAADSLRVISRDSKGRLLINKSGTIDAIVHLCSDATLSSNLILVVLNLSNGSDVVDVSESLIRADVLLHLYNLIVNTETRQVGRLACLWTLANLAKDGRRKDLLMKKKKLLNAVINCIHERQERVSLGALEVLLAICACEDEEDTEDKVNIRKNFLIDHGAPQAALILLDDERVIEGVEQALLLILSFLEGSINRVRTLLVLGLEGTISRVGARMSNDPGTVNTLADIEGILSKFHGEGSSYASLSNFGIMDPIQATSGTAPLTPQRMTLQLKKEIKMLREQLDISKQRETELTKTLDRRMREMADIEQTASEATRSRDSLTRAKRDLEQQLIDNQNSLRHYQDLCENLKGEIDAQANTSTYAGDIGTADEVEAARLRAEARVRTLIGELQGRDREIEHASSVLERAVLERQELESRVSLLEDEYIQLRKINVGLEVKLRSAQDEHHECKLRNAELETMLEASKVELSMMVSERDAALEAQHNLEREYRQQQEVMEGSKLQGSKQNSKQNSRKNKAANLQENSEASVMRINFLQEKLQEVEQENDSANEKIETLQSKINMLVKSLETQDKAMEKISNEAAGEKELNEKLEKRNRELEGQVTAITIERDEALDANKSIEGIRSEAEKERDQAFEALVKTDIRLDETKRALKELQRMEKRQKRAIKQTTDAMVADSSDITPELPQDEPIEISELREEHKELKEKLKETQEKFLESLERRQKADEIAKSAAVAEEAAVLLKREFDEKIDSWKSQLSQLQEENTRLKTNFERMKERYNKCTEIERDLAYRMEEKTRDIDSLQATMTDLQASLVTVTDQKAKTELDLQTSQTNEKNLTRRIEEKATKINTLEKSVATLRDATQDLVNKNDTLSKELEELKVQMLAASKDQEALHVLTLKHENLEAELAETKMSEEEIRNNFESLQREKSLCDASMASLQQEQETVLFKNKSISSELEQLRETEDELRSLLTKLQEDFSSSEVCVSELREETESLSSRNTELQQELAQAIDNESRLGEQLLEADKNQGMLQDNIKTLESEKAKLQEEIKSLQDDIVDRESRENVLKSQLQELDVSTSSTITAANAEVDGSLLTLDKMGEIKSKLESEVVELKGKEVSLTKELESKNQELETAKSRLKLADARDGEMEDCLSKIESLEKELKVKTTLLEGSRAKDSENEATFEVVQQELQESKKAGAEELARVKAECDANLEELQKSTQLEVEKLKSEIQEKVSQVKRLEDELESSSHKFETELLALKSSLEDSSTSDEERKGELEALRVSLNEKQEEYERTVHQLELSRSELDELETEVSSRQTLLRKCLNSARDELRRVDAVTRKAKQLVLDDTILEELEPEEVDDFVECSVQELKDLFDKVSAKMKDSIGQLETCIGKQRLLNMSMSELDDLRNELETKTKQCLAVNEEMATCNEEMEKMKLSVAEVNKAKENTEKDMEQMQRNFDEKENMCKELMKKVNELQALVENDEDKMTFQELQAQFEALQTERDELSVSYESAIANSKASEERTTNITKEMEEIQSELRSLEEELGSIKNENNDLNKTLTAVRNENDEMSNEVAKVDRIKNDLLRVSEERDDLLKSIDRYSDELIPMHLSLEQKSKEIERLSASLETTASDRDTYKTKVSKLEVELDVSQSALAEKINTLEKTVSRIDEMEEEKRRLEKLHEETDRILKTQLDNELQTNELKKQLGSSRDEITVLNHELSRMGANLEETKEQRDIFEKRSIELLQQLNKTKEELSTSLDQLQVDQTRVQELDEENRRIKSLLEENDSILKSQINEGNMLMELRRKLTKTENLNKELLRKVADLTEKAECDTVLIKRFEIALEKLEMYSTMDNEENKLKTEKIAAERALKLVENDLAQETRENRASQQRVEELKLQVTSLESDMESYKEKITCLELECSNAKEWAVTNRRKLDSKQGEANMEEIVESMTETKLELEGTAKMLEAVQKTLQRESRAKEYLLAQQNSLYDTLAAMIDKVHPIDSGNSQLPVMKRGKQSKSKGANGKTASHKSSQDKQGKQKKTTIRQSIRQTLRAGQKKLRK
eukprot:m.15175 g.15175  ORF g.15175 m.15175 type:complete len:2497 (+) comp5312_c0_seq1:208-7698(+)